MANQVPTEGSLDRQPPGCPGEGQTLPTERKGAGAGGGHETDRTLPCWATSPLKHVRAQMCFLSGWLRGHLELWSRLFLSLCCLGVREGAELLLNFGTLWGGHFSLHN